MLFFDVTPVYIVMYTTCIRCIHSLKKHIVLYISHFSFEAGDPLPNNFLLDCIILVPFCFNGNRTVMLVS